MEFASEPGLRALEGSELSGRVDICLRLACVGSYEPTATLEQEVVVNIHPTGRSGTFLVHNSIAIMCMGNTACQYNTYDGQHPGCNIKGLSLHPLQLSQGLISLHRTALSRSLLVHRRGMFFALRLKF